MLIDEVADQQVVLGISPGVTESEVVLRLVAESMPKS
jgi:hypothetical protein